MKILITGANNGLGLQLCKSLLDDGHHIFAISKNVDNLKKINHKNLLFYKVDIRNYYEIQTVVDQINKHSTSIDILINNAAVYIKSNIVEITSDEIENIIDTNIKGVIFTSKLTLSKILPGPGKIIMINSVAGLHGIEYESIYSASKFALNGFSESLQIELKNKNISITNIYPGGINTTLWNDKNPYNGSTNDLLKKEDIAGLVRLIVTLPNSQILKNITIYPTSENH